LSTTEFLPLLVLGGALLGLANQFILSLYAIGEPKKYRDSYIISTIIYIASAVILTYYFSAMGMAFAYFISCLALFLTTFLFIKRSLDLKLPLKDIGKMIAALIVPSLFLAFILPFVPNIWVAIPFALIFVFIFLATLLKLNFYVKEDLKILDFVADRMPISILKRIVITFKEIISRFVDNDFTNHCK
jgi:O-antigen/teichoic acid export membrane protein